VLKLKGKNFIDPKSLAEALRTYMRSDWGTLVIWVHEFETPANTTRHVAHANRGNALLDLLWLSSVC
jgi:hypothetical protein